MAHIFLVLMMHMGVQQHIVVVEGMPNKETCEAVGNAAVVLGASKFVCIEDPKGG